MARLSDSRSSLWEYVNSEGAAPSIENKNHAALFGLEAHSIISAMADGVSIVRLDGEIVDCNDAALEMHGFSRDEYVGENVLKFVSPEDSQRLVQKARAALEGRSSTVDVKALKKDSTTFDAEISISPLRDSSGRPLAFLWITRDISERKKVEEALRRSEEQTRRLLEFQNKVIDTAVVWIDLLDSEGNVTLWNRAAELISGYSREEVIGHNKIWEWLYPDPQYRAKIFAEAQRIIKKGERVENYETIIRCKDGALKTISWYSNNILDENGKPVGSIAIGIDVTEIKNAQEKIRASEERYRDLFENARDVIVTLDLRGNVTSVNKAAEEYGFKKDNVIGKNMLSFVPKKYWPRLFKDLAGIIRGKPAKGEVEIIAPTGRRLAAEYKSNPIRRGGKVVGIQTILWDITERKEMEEKLRQYSEQLEELVQKRTEELLESERRYSVLVEEASDGVVILQDGRIVFVNKRGPKIIGYSREELIWLPFEKLVNEKYRQLARERYERRLRGEKVPPTYEIELISKTGERVPVELSAACITYQGRPADLLIVRDIRERKRIQEQLLKSERLAAIGELATMVAHDLRNPLTSIRNAAYYLKKHLPCTKNEELETVSEMLGIIERETLFASNIINDLLDFTTERKLQKRRKNVNKVIEESLAKGDIPQNIEIKTSFARKAVAPVDEKQLERVFLNLIKNAVQAMPNGGKLTVKTREAKGHIEVTFTDTGVGIPEENMSKIFTPFFTTKAKGVGLGLALCKRIIEQHRGEIEVKSEVGKGTTFTIKLPKG